LIHHLYDAAAKFTNLFVQYEIGKWQNLYFGYNSPEIYFAYARRVGAAEYNKIFKRREKISIIVDGVGIGIQVK
jgi:hypothetical protein